LGIIFGDFLLVLTLGVLAHNFELLVTIYRYSDNSFCRKIGWGIIFGDFSQTHLVTLEGSKKNHQSLKQLLHNGATLKQAFLEYNQPYTIKNWYQWSKIPTSYFFVTAYFLCSCRSFLVTA
jgi:hypothetical protein